MREVILTFTEMLVKNNNKTTQHCVKISVQLTKGEITWMFYKTAPATTAALYLPEIALNLRPHWGIDMLFCHALIGGKIQQY